MSKKLLLYFIFLLYLVLIFSCASSRYSRGRAFLEDEKYDQAIKTLLLELKENRGNQDAWRDLGIAYFKSGDYNKAESALLEAYQREANDGSTIFYLGATAEKKQDIEQAISYYRKYGDVTRFSKMRGKIEARLEWLTQQQMQLEAKKALANEDAIEVASIPENTVAVLYFKNLGSASQLDPLQKGLADMVITDLSQVRDLKVVERVKLQKLMEEMGLGLTGLVDQQTAPRVGKLLGASKLIKGSFIDLDQENIRMDAGMVESKSGQFQKVDESTGELERIFRLEKNLVFNVIDRMGISLTDEERESILYIPTESLLAFLAYSKGLDYEDRGNYAAAEAQYQQAVSIDPNFEQAKNRMEKAETLQEGPADISEIETGISTEKAAEPTSALASGGLDTRSRLESSMSNIEVGFVPSAESREPVQEQTNLSGFGTGIPVEIEIRLPDSRSQ